MNQAEQIQELTKLREELMSGLVPLIDSGDLEPGERFDLYSRLAQSRGDLEYYKKAYQAAQDMSDSGDKLQAYLALMGDVDFEIQSKTDESAAVESQAAAPQTNV
ncbi:MAG: hypothetical protein WBK76_02585 [Candidatus Saccharimonadales bacterium]